MNPFSHVPYIIREPRYSTTIEIQQKPSNGSQKAIAYDSNMREKEKLDMYDILCRITHQNIYTVELEDEARQTNNIRYRAWALLYRGINNQDRELANQAFEVANQIKENKDSTLGPMYYHYFQALMDRGNVPDSILISYAKKAQDNFGVKIRQQHRFLSLAHKKQQGNPCLRHAAYQRKL